MIVTALHVVFGRLFGAPIDYTASGEIIVVATAGDFVGGSGLVTLTSPCRGIVAPGFSSYLEGRPWLIVTMARNAKPGDDE